MNITASDIDIGPCDLRFYPSAVFFCVLLVVVGIPGNCLILYIYTNKINIHITSFFIKILAILNLVSTSCLLPVYMHVVSNPNIGNGSFLCSWFSFGQHFFGLNTGLLYIVIAGQRFRKICRHGQTQLKEHDAKKILLGCTLFSVLSCSPNAFVTKAEKYNISSSEGLCWTSHCDFTAEERGNHISTLYTSWVMLELIAIFVTLVVLYALISKHVGLHKRTLSRLSISSQSQMKVTNPTRIFFCLTVIFLVSSAPRVLQTLYCSVANGNDHQTSANTHYVYDGIIILPFINCIVNPFVFGFTSRVFRHHLMSLIHARIKINRPQQLPADMRLSVESMMPM